MELIFKNITIKNFKGLTELYLDFDEKKNIIEGENGIGKTTVLDAITWCLFGKNFADEMKFKIKPIIDGEEKNELTTSVILTVNDKTIERIWDKDTTTIKVDGVKFGVNEFKNYLRDNFLITDEEFKALSNIDYIPKLHWKDLRTLIMGLVGEIQNSEVYEKGDFSLIKEKIESVGVEKTSEDIKTTKSDLSNEIKRLSGNIDQKTSDIQSLVINDEEIKEYKIQKEKIKSDIDNYNLLKNELSKQNDEIRALEIATKRIEKANEEIKRLEDLNVQYQKTYDESNIDVNIVKENKIKLVQVKINDKQDEIKKIELEKDTLIVERKELKDKYDLEINKEIRIENDKCSACGQALPQERLEQVLSNLKEQSISLANGYANKAKEKLERMGQLDIVIQICKDQIKEYEQEKQQILDEQIPTDMESDVQKAMKNNIEYNVKSIEGLKNDIVIVEKEIVELKEKISNHKTISIPDNINDLQNELEEITKKLAISDTLQVFKNQLKELEDKYQDLLNQKEMLNEKEQQLILFNNTKAEMLREKVRHNFKLVDFITQEETKDGKLVETFKIALNGIEYASVNTGHKILLALDLIDNIQRLKQKRLPILIDGLGELTRLPEISTQIIGCRAKFQVNKKMEVTNI